MAAASTSNPSFIVEVGEDIQYPYPSHVIAPNFVTVKLNSKTEYELWTTQILCLLSSHDMLGFIDGQFLSPSDGKGKAKEGDMKAWYRSDSLVKGWILGSLSKQTAMSVVNRLTSIHKKAEFTAKDAWDELQRKYGPSTLDQVTAEEDAKAELLASEGIYVGFSGTGKRSNKDRMYSYILQVISECQADKIYGGLITLEQVNNRFSEEGLTTTDKITNNGSTALHVAVASSINSFELLEILLEMTPEENKLPDLKNSDGNTLLHVAAIVGNTKAVDILVRKDPELLLAKDNEGHTPLALSLSNVHSETSQCLVICFGAKVAGALGFLQFLLKILIRLAENMHDKREASYSDDVLMALAQYFPPELKYWEKERGACMDIFKEIKGRIFRYERSCSNSWVQMIIAYIMLGLVYIAMVFERILKAIVWPFTEDKRQIYFAACELLHDEFYSNYHANRIDHIFTNTIFEATRHNAFVVVAFIVEVVPNAIWFANEDGHNCIQYSVINRSEKIYRLLKSEHMNIYRTIKDSSGNNLLHLAARLAPSNKLNLISGAALQIQRELQWFREVEGFVCPLNRILKNSDDETPQMVFTREHKDLVIEGEKWIKSTAESYTITAALITTIVFAAAITVPGGNNQEGIPIFTNDIAFTIFAISDAISLFTAVTSLLMFLSILTTRFAEQDFLFNLPKRLIIGLTMLFLSTTTMIIAFGATLFLVFGQRNLWMLIPIGALTCLPITSFVTLQFPLIVDLISATYGRSIFVKKKSDKYFY